MNLQPTSMIEAVRAYYVIHRSIFGSTHSLTADQMFTLWESAATYSAALLKKRPRIFKLYINEREFLPYMEWPDIYSGSVCLSHPLEISVYALYRYYIDRLPADKMTPIEAYFPLVRKQDDTFDDFLRNRVKGNRRSYFFGAKSQAVKWGMQPGNFLTRESIARIIDMSLDHNQDFAEKTGSYEPWIQNSAWWSFYWATPMEFSLAVDIERNEYVSAMVCFVNRHSYDGNIICKDISEKYKPYGLILNSHINLCRHAFYERSANLVNLGVNFTPMDYKDDIQHEKEQILNLPLYPKEFSLAEIQSLYERF